MANRLNVYFITIASKLVANLPPPSGLFGTEHIKAFYSNLGVRKDDFELAMVSTDEVLKNHTRVN